MQFMHNSIGYGRAIKDPTIRQVSEYQPDLGFVPSFWVARVDDERRLSCRAWNAVDVQRTDTRIEGGVIGRLTC